MKKLFLLVVTVAITCVLSAQTVIFSDNFDRYAANTYLVQQTTKTLWTTWNNAPGTTEDAYVTTEQAQSAPNSLKITGENDIIYPISNYITGAYNIDFDYYVPSTGNGAYFNVQHNYIPGRQWAFECSFMNNGKGELIIGRKTLYFTYPQNAWFHILIAIDLNDDNIKITINDNQVCDVPFRHYENNHYRSCTLGSVNFYAGTSDNLEGTYYVDNFIITEIEAATAGHISVNPRTTIKDEINYRKGGNTSLTLKNTGNDFLEYRVVPTYPVDKTNMSSADSVVLAYYVSEDNFFALSNSGNVDVWVAGIEFPAENIQDYIGKRITQVSVKLDVTKSTDTKVQIYQMGQLVAPGPGKMVYEQTFNAVKGWNTINLNTPYYIDGSDFWIGVSINQPSKGGGIGMDDSPANDYSNWIYSNSEWHRCLEYDGSWCIKATIVGDTYTPWLTLTPGKGALYADENQEVTVSVAPSNEQGHKNAKIVVLTNDFFNPTINLDVNVNFTNVDNDENNTIDVYLNPIGDLIHVEVVQIDKVEIYNLDGQLIYTDKVNGSHASINVSSLAAGTYLVKVFAGDKTEVHKIIKK